MLDFNVSPESTRAQEVIDDFNGSVVDWVSKYDVLKSPTVKP
jgi:hypothetical protein